jgi:pimeloyl-ACP methyl ester carboxylesterase
MTPDYAGHANAQNKPYEGDPLMFAADSISSAIEHAGYEVTLVGHSMGGALALLIAQRQPDFVTAIGSIEGNLIGGKVSRAIARAADDDEAEKIKAGLIATAARSKNAGWQLWARTMAPLSPRVLRDYALSLTNLAASGLLPEMFHRFNGPKAYIYGDRYDTTALASLDKRLTHRVKGADHFVMQDAPATCADLIRRNLLSARTEAVMPPAHAPPH